MVKNEKDGFSSSGSSPTFSPSGAPIRTGRGVEEINRRIAEAFEKARQQTLPQKPVQQAPPPAPQQPAPQPKVYTEESAAKFHERAKHLASKAITTAYISRTARNGVHEIEVPVESADELIKRATKGRDEK